MASKGWKQEIHKRDKCCKICGSTQNLTVHHCLALARGGKSTLENCISLCATCHREYHKEWGLTTSDCFGNPIGGRYQGSTAKKNKQKNRGTKKRKKGRGR